MPNINQNNKIENINKEISLLQDRLEINENGLNQFINRSNQIKNRLMQIRRIQGQRTNLSKVEKIYFKKSIKHIKK